MNDLPELPTLQSVSSSSSSLLLIDTASPNDLKKHLLTQWNKISKANAFDGRQLSDLFDMLISVKSPTLTGKMDDIDVTKYIKPMGTITFDEFFARFSSSLSPLTSDRINSRAQTWVSISEFKPAKLPVDRGAQRRDNLITPYEDFVQKKSRGMFKSWAKRYLAIDMFHSFDVARTSTLTFYHDNKKKKFNRQIPLNEITQVALVTKTEGNKSKTKAGLFEVRTSKGEIFEALADTDDAAVNWGYTILTHMLMDAITNRESLERISVIVKNGANTNKDLLSGSGIYPLVVIAAKNYGIKSEVVDLILKSGDTHHSCLLRWQFLIEEHFYEAKDLLSIFKKAGCSLDTTSDDGHKWTILHYLVLSEEIDSVIIALETMSSEFISMRNLSGDNALLLALKLCTPKSIEIAKILISKTDLTIKDSVGETAIHIALKRKQEELALLMMEQGANLNHTDPEGNNCLHMAIKLEMHSLAMRMSTVPLLNLNSKERSNGDTALSLAIKLGAQELACHLLDYKANPNISCDNWKMLECVNDFPLHITIKMNLQKITVKLIDHGADVLKRDTKGFGALHLAIMKKQFTVADELLKTESAAQLINMNDSNSTSDTPFLLTVSSGNIALGFTMLKKGANPNVMNVFGENALHKYVYGLCNLLDGNLSFEIQEKLMENNIGENEWLDFASKLLAAGGNCKAQTGASKSVQVASKENCRLVSMPLGGKQTALHLITALNDVALKFARIFFNHDCEVINLKNEQGESPLTYAIQSDYNELVQAYISASPKGSLDYLNNKGQSPLHLSVKCKNIESIKSLVSAGAYTQLWDKEGNAPLHLAAIGDVDQVVDIFRKAGSNLDDKNEDGFTAVMLAVIKGSSSILRALLKYNVDLKIRVPKSRKNLLHLSSDVSGFPNGPCPPGYINTVNLILGITNEITIPSIVHVNLPSDSTIIAYLSKINGVVKEDRDRISTFNNMDFVDRYSSLKSTATISSLEVIDGGIDELDVKGASVRSGSAFSSSNKVEISKRSESVNKQLPQIPLSSSTSFRNTPLVKTKSASTTENVAPIQPLHTTNLFGVMKATSSSPPTSMPIIRRSPSPVLLESSGSIPVKETINISEVNPISNLIVVEINNNREVETITSVPKRSSPPISSDNNKEKVVGDTKRRQSIERSSPIPMLAAANNVKEVLITPPITSSTAVVIESDKVKERARVPVIMAVDKEVTLRERRSLFGKKVSDRQLNVNSVSQPSKSRSPSPTLGNSALPSFKEDDDLAKLSSLNPPTSKPPTLPLIPVSLHNEQESEGFHFDSNRRMSKQLGFDTIVIDESKKALARLAPPNTPPPSLNQLLSSSLSVKDVISLEKEGNSGKEIMKEKVAEVKEEENETKKEEFNGEKEDEKVKENEIGIELIKEETIVLKTVKGEIVKESVLMIKEEISLEHNYIDIEEMKEEEKKNLGLSLPFPLKHLDDDDDGDESGIQSGFSTPSVASPVHINNERVIKDADDSEFMNMIKEIQSEEELLKALIELQEQERMAIIIAKVDSRNAASEWLKIEDGKKLLKKQARKLLHESEVDGKETITVKDAKTKAKVNFISKAEEEGENEARALFELRKAAIFKQIALHSSSYK